MAASVYGHNCTGILFLPDGQRLSFRVHAFTLGVKPKGETLWGDDFDQALYRPTDVELTFQGTLTECQAGFTSPEPLPPPKPKVILTNNPRRKLRLRRRECTNASPTAPAV